MTNSSIEPAPGLMHWHDVNFDTANTGLLLGNGASMAVWRKFGYPSLFQIAISDQIEHSLTEADKEFFELFGESNFETVLSALNTAKLACRTLSMDTSSLDSRYGHIRDALIDAVQKVHIPWDRISLESKRFLGEVLSSYRSVFSTNYDLLIYWSTMAYNPRLFADFFFEGNRFNLGNTDLRMDYTTVSYLHGALHLYEDQAGRTYKHVNNENRNILDLFRTVDESRRATPLFITEGTAEDKLRSIYSSDYLSFSMNRFRDHAAPLVIFGQSLGLSDGHLIKAVSRWPDRIPIAISVFPNSDDDSDSMLARTINTRRLLRKTDIRLFDSRTHPLGSAFLEVAVSE